ncbi:hypothetical protein N0V95_001166 [Ascochyta clinopodiicola]|nr:hypothetical protein N0V95_001166 [Ascochyta clinopodiicola]
MKHRLQVCQTNHTPVNWDSPQWTWRYPLKLLKQRWPLCKLVLRSADELFVDIGQLLRNHELKLSQKEQDGLWQELIVAFDNYDATYVMDCLDRGAPDNRFHKESLEYPLHMAARFGDMEILQRLLPSGNYATSAEDDRITILEDFNAQLEYDEFGFRDGLRKMARTSVYYRLLTPNADIELPLQLAVNANQNDAVSWILKRLLEIEVTSGHVSSAARDCVAAALAKVIKAEKLDMLKIFSETWPQWEKMHEDVSGFLEMMGNPPEPEAEFWFAFFVEHDPTPESGYLFDITQSFGVSKGYAKVLLEQGYDPGGLCGTALRESKRDCSRFLANCADHLSSFAPEILDCAVSNFSELTDDTASLWAAAGARDWSEFLNTLRDMNLRGVEDLIQAQALHGDCCRMVNAIFYYRGEGTIGWGDAQYRSMYTARALTRLVVKSSYVPTAEIESTVQLFINHGASVLQSSALARSTLFDVLLGGTLDTDYEARESILDILIEAAVNEEVQDRSKAGTALKTCCEALVQQFAGSVVSIFVLGCMRGLLRLGCDPETACDGDETPQVFLENGLQDSYAVDMIGTTRPSRYKAHIIQIAIDMLSNWSQFHRNPTSSIPEDDFEDGFPKEEDYPESPWGSEEDDFNVSEVGSEEHLL